MTDLTTIFPNAKVVDGINTSRSQMIDNLNEELNSKENNVVILNLPSKGSANEFDVKLWDQVRLSSTWRLKAKNAGIPYEMECFTVSRITRDSLDQPISYNLSGSMGGGWLDIDWNQGGIIDSVGGNLIS